MLIFLSFSNSGLKTGIKKENQEGPLVSNSFPLDWIPIQINTQSPTGESFPNI